MLNSKSLYAIKHLWLNRKDLSQYLSKPGKHISAVTDLNAAQLNQDNIQAIIFDFDGVLASHGEINIPHNIGSWLRNFLQTYSGQTFLLSNNLFSTRNSYLQTNWPELKIITAARKKPYPDGILRIIKITNLHPQQILMIDDRLGTGILAAYMADIKGLLVTPALSNYSKRPIVETFFATLRLLENFICLI
jgi:uncharacterized protein